MEVNKVILDGDTLLDVSQDTVTPGTLMKGATAHNAAGNQITGTLDVATQSADGLFPAADKQKLDGIQSGAEANQNAFTKVVAGSTTIEADSKTDTLTIAAGNNITLTADAANDKLTIAAKDTTYNAVTQSANGLMIAADKKKLDGVAAEAQPNTLESITVNGSAVSISNKTAAITIPTKTSALTNDSDFQTGTQVETAINAKVSSTYKAGGSVSFSALPALSAANLGLVVNLTDNFTTNANFVEGTGKSYPAGTNVAVVASGSSYKYDVLAGFVDLSGKVDKVSGKGLSTNDYTTAEKDKLASVESGAQANTVTGIKGNSESSYRTGNVNLTPANIGAVPTTRTVNGKALSGDITLTASDVGATANTGTVTSVATGAGLTGGTITTTGTIKANLLSETKLSNAATAATETAGRVYPVSVDKNGKLAVNVPWVDTNTHTITGVKGDSESSYRTGNVNLTPANIGAVPTSRTVNSKALSANITLAKSDVGLGNVPNVATNDQTPSYTEASDLVELTSGEKLSAAFGKLAKAVKDLISHIADTTRHITASERTAWNNKVDKVSGKGLSTNDYTTAEKDKLVGIAANANNYSLPTATTSVLGGVKIGTNIGISSGTISVANGTTSAKGVVQLSSATNSTSTALAATASAVKAAYDLANGKTANTGTVTKVSTGVGLTGGDVTTTGTIKAKLKTETAHTLDSAAQTNTANRQYAVGVDKSGCLSVNVPWTNTTYSSKAAANGGTEVSLVTTGEKYTWNAVVPADRGGSGKTTLQDSANAYINALSEGEAIPVDDTYIISQFVGNETKSTYHRRKLSTFWKYIKSKIDTLNFTTGVKGNAESAYRTGQVNITPANIGLGNVNNTSDANKPISTATQTALNAKADKAGTTAISVTNAKIPIALNNPSFASKKIIDANTMQIHSDGVLISNPGTYNDAGWIRVQGTSDSDTAMEVATGDNGNEPIYVRQYNGGLSIKNQAALLDANGNTSFPHNVNVAGTITATGGTLTGLLSLKANQYSDAMNAGALNMQNSNIYGLNSIYTADASDGAAEGIHFYRDTTHVDSLWMNGGVLLFVPNREIGVNTSKADSQKVGRFTSTPASSEIVVTAGTDGEMNSSGHTIASIIERAVQSQVLSIAMALTMRSIAANDGACTTIENSEFVAVWVDKGNHILCGIYKDGSFFTCDDCIASLMEAAG